jgi:hypothetical protein
MEFGEMVPSPFVPGFPVTGGPDELFPEEIAPTFWSLSGALKLARATIQRGMTLPLE